jgi:hypothetical protein
MAIDDKALSAEREDVAGKPPGPACDAENDFPTWISCQPAEACLNNRLKVSPPGRLSHPPRLQDNCQEESQNHQALF